MEIESKDHLAIYCNAPATECRVHVFDVTERDPEADAKWIAEQFKDAYAFYYYKVRPDIKIGPGDQLITCNVQHDFSERYFIDAGLMTYQDVLGLPYTHSSLRLITKMAEHNAHVALRLRGGNVITIEPVPYQLVSSN